MKLIDELKRRNVFRVGAAYVLLGWLVIQVTDTVSPALNLPDWTLGLVTWLGIIGLPFAVFFAWAFELTPDGIKRETDIDRSESVSGATGRKLDFALVSLLLIVVVFIAWDFTADRPRGDGLVAESLTDAAGGLAKEAAPMSIAVLPLINMSALPDNAYFSSGVHEEILTNLSHIDDLRVVSRTTALRYINSDLTLREIGRELDVRFIVEGSVRRINNHVRITVQLIDAAKDAHLWASNYDRELVDVFATQTEVAREITNSLHLEIRPETVGTLDDMPTRSVRAYDLYMKARSIDRSEPESEAALLRQRELLEAAVAEDSDFVEAWGFLNEILDHCARNIIQNDWFGDTKEERDASFAEIRQAAQRALDKAIALDPDNVETLLAQASDFVSEQESREFQLGRKEFIDRAIELDSDNALAWLVLGWWYRIEGDIESATPAFRSALELDPLHARILLSSLVHFRLSGDQEMTTRLFERLTQIAPEKGEETSLAEVPISIRLNNLLALFIETADESIIESYAAAVADMDNYAQNEIFGPNPHRFQFEKTMHQLNLLQMQNDMDGLLNLDPFELPDDHEGFATLAYLWSNCQLMAVQLVARNRDEAVGIARRMIEVHDQKRIDADGQLAIYADYVMLTAYVLLEDHERVFELKQTLLDSDEEIVAERFPGRFVALSMVDIDQAVEHVLQRESQQPNWYFIDFLATSHVVFRHVIVHPDLQAHYLEEGKWIDYLAARVPEYSQYGQ